MIYEVLEKRKLPAHKVPFIGDALRDMQAAYAAGCPRILVRTGKGKETEQSPQLFSLKPVLIVEDILEAARHVVQGQFFPKEKEA